MLSAYLKQASDHGDIIANYYLGKHHKYSDHDEAEKLLQRVAADSASDVAGNYPLDERKDLRYLAKGDLKDISHQKAIEEKNKELNNLVAMFAHNFLGTLQCIRSNAEHENNPTIHLKTVKMMGGCGVTWNRTAETMAEQFIKDDVDWGLHGKD